MKVLVVSWEYPPVVVGGLGRHVHHLAEALAEHGLDVTVLTRQPPGTDSSTHPTTDTVVNGVRVVANVLEDAIGHAPGQWVLFQRAWPAEELTAASERS